MSLGELNVAVEGWIEANGRSEKSMTDEEFEYLSAVIDDHYDAEMSWR